MGYSDTERKRSYQNEWTQRRRKAWIEENGPCPCGSWDRPEVDHIDPALKTMNPSQIWSRREEVRLAELANCRVLCCSCHRKRSGKQASLRHRGTGNLNAKLGIEEVRLIRNSTTPCKELALRFGVHVRTVEKVRFGHKWQKVPT